MRTTALITGASKGIGFEIARLLGERGITAVVGARDPERGKTAAALWDTPVKVNACDPGWCDTDASGHQGIKTAAEGAEIAVRLATLGEDAPTAGFFRDDGPLPW